MSHRPHPRFGPRAGLLVTAGVAGLTILAGVIIPWHALPGDAQGIDTTPLVTSAPEATTIAEVTTTPPVTIAKVTTLPAVAATSPPAVTTASGAVVVATVETSSTTTEPLEPTSTVERGSTTSASASTSTGASTTSTSTTESVISVSQNPDTENDVAPSEAPPQEIPVLPAPNLAAPKSLNLEQALRALSAEQRAKVLIAQQAADEVTVKVQAAQIALQQSSDQATDIGAKKVRLEASLIKTTEQMRARSIAAYTGERLELLNILVSSKDVDSLLRRAELVNAAQHARAELVSQFRGQQQELTQEEKDLSGLVDDRRNQLEQLVKAEQDLTAKLEAVKNELGAIEGGTQVALGGFVFPVQPPFQFTDTFGAPRMVGTPDYHTHQGNDIFGTRGSPLRACVRGVIRLLGQNRLGGNKLWLVGADGSAYYYAHLSAFTEGVVNGTVVNAGDVVGFLGDSGNAAGTSPHLHFEFHPGGGPAVDPFPLLDSVRKSDSEALFQAIRAAAATTTSTSTTTTSTSTTTTSTSTTTTSTSTTTTSTVAVLDKSAVSASTRPTGH